MSRIGKQPVTIPSGVTAKADGGSFTCSGPKGNLEFRFHTDMSVEVADGAVKVTRPSDTKQHKALHGLTRALIANMVNGVVEGYSRGLDIQGIGYDAKIDGNNLSIRVGFAKPAVLEIPKGLTVTTPHPTRIEVAGPDKQQVGQFAATVRRVRPPDPYTTKGIKYADEVIKKKAGKSFGAGQA